MSDPRALAIEALRRMMGTKAAEARRAFEGLTAAEMAGPYEADGRTRAQVLLQLEQEEATVLHAIRWVERLPAHL